MTGRRLADLIALVNVSSSIAQKHFLIRSQQLNVYTTTSSVLKSFRARPSIVNSRVAQASARASTSSGAPLREGIEQDHFYTPGASTTIDPEPRDDLPINQKKADRYPLPDGTIPPSNNPKIGLNAHERDKDHYSARPVSEPTKGPISAKSHELNPASTTASTILSPTHSRPSAEEAKRLQHASESSIPEMTADPPTEDSTQGTGNDIFYLRQARVSSVLSNLPRKKIPKRTEGEQAPTSFGTLNADVFYETPGQRQDAKIPEKVAIPERDEGLNSELFHSRRAKTILSQPTKQPELKPETVGTPKDKTGLNEGKDQASFYVQEDGAEIPSTSNLRAIDKETAELASELSKDAEEHTKPIVEQASSSQMSSSHQPETPAFQMSASRVPSSRLGRLFHYGGLATGMAWGAATESLKRATGLSGGDGSNGIMLSPANIERLVKKLSRMRGAALKFGQMMSFQDSKMLPPAIHEVLTRVQDSADYMPASQRDQVLTTNLGPNWRDLFSDFSEIPMAAASIGQVHAATLASNGLSVAVKIQYPGVADSISSDLSNLAVLLTASRLLPKGLYLEKTIANARTELGWECDYIREGECAKRFRELLKDDTDVFRVPKVVDEACGPHVLTMERMWGIGVTKVMDKLTQEERDWIGTQVLKLCFREVKEFNFMQTDPNWTNFLWNAKDKKIELLDFGASRAYDPPFVDLYCSLLTSAARNDISAVQEYSQKLGYLTGLESETMLKAHVGSILTLAEPFARTAPEIYDFRDQTVTDRVREFIPLMIRERLTPPPEETYSLHRKLSGAFLMCARLGSRVPCRGIFKDVLGAD